MCSRTRGHRLGQCRQAALDDFLLAIALGPFGGFLHLPPRQVANRGQDAQELDAILGLLADVAQQLLLAEPRMRP